MTEKNSLKNRKSCGSKRTQMKVAKIKKQQISPTDSFNCSTKSKKQKNKNKKERKKKETRRTATKTFKLYP